MDNKKITINSRGGGALHSQSQCQGNRCHNDNIKPLKTEEYKPKLSFVLGRKGAF